jgi:signal transduction histidine kinase
LAGLGKSSEASRVYIFENYLTKAGEILTSQRYEWAAPGIEPQLDNPELQNFSWREAGFARWEEQLSRGQTIVGEVREFPPSEQELLASQDIKSIVVVPIFVGQQWWGMIGFDDCLRKRKWSPVELETLKTAASTLGAAMLRERAEQSLRKSEQKLRSLTAQLITAQEDERKRLAFELHDDLGQALMVLKMQLQAIQKKSDYAGPGENLEKSINYINEIVEGVRRLSRNLRPSILEELGLAAALKYLFKELSNRNIQVTLDLDDIKGFFSVEAQLNIFRIFQESFSNIVKHAQATRVSVIMKRQDESVAFQVEDNGRGFDPLKPINGNVTERGLGLTAMDERARMLGGTFNIWSHEGRGTKITINVPIQGEIS